MQYSITKFSFLLFLMFFLGISYAHSEHLQRTKLFIRSPDANKEVLYEITQDQGVGPHGNEKFAHQGMQASYEWQEKGGKKELHLQINDNQTVIEYDSVWNYSCRQKNIYISISSIGTESKTVRVNGRKINIESPFFEIEDYNEDINADLPHTELQNTGTNYSGRYTKSEFIERVSRIMSSLNSEKNFLILTNDKGEFIDRRPALFTFDKETNRFYPIIDYESMLTNNSHHASSISIEFGDNVVMGSHLRTNQSPALSVEGNTVTIKISFPIEIRILSLALSCFLIQSFFLRIKHILPSYLRQSNYDSVEDAIAKNNIRVALQMTWSNSIPKSDVRKNIDILISRLNREEQYYRTGRITRRDFDTTINDISYILMELLHMNPSLSNPHKTKLGKDMIQ